MRLTLAYFLTFIVLLTSSCTTTKSRTFDYDYLFINKQGIIQRPLITDLDVVKQKVKITKTYNNLTLSEAKETIMGEFMQENNCDLIVQPYFSSSTVGTNQRTSLTITLTGFPASYKNIRQYEPKDSAYLLPRAYINNELNRPWTGGGELVPQKKKSPAGIVLLTLLLAGVVAAAVTK